MAGVTTHQGQLLLFHAARGSVCREHRPGPAWTVLVDLELDLGVEHQAAVNVRSLAHTHMLTDQLKSPSSNCLFRIDNCGRNGLL